MSNPNQHNSITPLAVTNYRDIRKMFGIKEKNRRGHMYIVGKTGTGKSTLMANMLASDIREGQGLALIDPHGDLAEQILDFVPSRRVEDVIYFNPADQEYPLAFNPLERVQPDDRHLVVSGVISVFKKIWPEFWGPRLEHILRYSLLTLLEFPNSTLLDLPKLLTEKDYRDRMVQQLVDNQVKKFWLFEFNTYSVWMRSEAVAPILNKIGQLFASPLVRNIVGQRDNAFDLRKIMDEGRILIVNLSKGKIGEDNCSVLGSMLLTKIQLAALSRAELPENKRRPFYLYVDEIHNFFTLSFADMLAEARKYGLSLTLAHQHLEQLDDRIRSAILGNVGTIISFRVGSEDAKYLAGEFEPRFDQNDLVSLPNYHIYLKLMVDGVTSQPFSAITLPLIERQSSEAKIVIRASRERYGKPRRIVECEITRSSESSMTLLPRALF